MKPLMVYSVLFLTAIQTQAHAKPMDLVLRLKERVPMETLARNVMNPSSDRYRKFYTPSEIRALSAPSDSDYRALMNSLSAEGMTVVRESKSHLFVTVRADSSKVESLFRTKLKVSGEKFAGNAKKLTIPSQFSLVESLTGLDQTAKLRPHYRVLLDQKTGSPVSQADIKKGYGFNPIYSGGITGKGQHIAVATYDGFHLSDVVDFYKKSNISPAPQIDQVEFNGTPEIKEDSAAETELDSEFSGMIAPGASIHVYASAENSDAGELAMFTAILDDARTNVLNYSWGTCEEQTSPSHQSDMDQLYARAIAQGVNILVASGDSGADGCQNGGTNADWPASAPNVVAVGGTSFSLTGSKLSETGWSLSGGGISGLYDLPDYQRNFQSPYNKRSFPDVSFNADNKTGEQIWTQYQTGTPHWMTIGGTSMAAPQWSGFLALVGEARAKAGKSALGFLNPAIYALSASDRAKVMHDITSGNNGYSAGPGWDAVTGLGSMQADALLDYLVSQ